MKDRIKQLRAEQKERLKSQVWHPPDAQWWRSHHGQAEAALTEALDIAEWWEKANDANNAGMNAFNNGMKREDNPFPKPTTEDPDRRYYEWLSGYEEAEQERLLERAVELLRMLDYDMFEDGLSQPNRWPGGRIVAEFLSDLDARSVK